MYSTLNAYFYQLNNTGWAYFVIITIRYTRTMSDWKETVSANLKKWRESYDWSQDELAERAGCSKSVVRDLEAKSSGASVDMLSKLAGALNIELAQLFQNRDAQLIQNLSAKEIGEMAEGAPFNKLLDIVVSKIKSVPEDIVEMSYFFKPSEEAWTDVRKVLNDDLKKSKPKKVNQDLNEKK